ncbi:hypothetical protein QA646_11655 [Rhizobium sp. CB3090]|uniref:hypothetical protein n=1 Tax=Rhizobium sp. CB3090 TaxID=3039156 RepID=UPI0024B0BE33|nr:hypothetical protein [Rhizobium sp. CB3090]WFU07969.1 hypothetical protein QA646_11655 [Rhizobium sp. CB3090]
MPSQVIETHQEMKASNFCALCSRPERRLSVAGIRRIFRQTMKSTAPQFSSFAQSLSSKPSASTDPSTSQVTLIRKSEGNAVITA